MENLLPCGGPLLITSLVFLYRYYPSWILPSETPLRRSRFLSRCVPPMRLMVAHQQFKCNIFNPPIRNFRITHHYSSIPSVGPYTYPVLPVLGYTDTLPAPAAPRHRRYVGSQFEFSRHAWRKSMPDNNFFSF